jgi:hypothetical protein
MMDSKEFIDLQNEIVQGLAKAVKQPWDFFVVNFECELIDGERTQDTLAIAFKKQNTSWSRTSFVAPYESCLHLSRLSDLMSKAGNSWGSCTLEVDATGKYRFTYSQEPPRRLNGEFNDEALLKTYIPQSW